MNIRQGLLPFNYEIEADSEPRVTAHAGLPIFLEALRALVTKKMYRKLARALNIKAWRTARRHAESALLLIASGGGCIDDIRCLKADAGLSAMLGFSLSSPTQLKSFLYAFHQSEAGELLTAAQDRELSAKGSANVRPEGPGLKALQEWMGATMKALQRIVVRHRATLDVDATIVEAQKKTALKAYEGTVGYQPQMAWWAEHGIWVCDEFRDGNVPAEYEAKRYLERAFAALPGSVTERFLRADSAFYNEQALTWADKNNIQFAVSADMSAALAQAITGLSSAAWKPYTNPNHTDTTEERQWADVTFVPGWARNHKKEGKPFRYIAIRVRSRQQSLLPEPGEGWRHFAVVTNMGWAGERLLRWQREKQGTVEHGHGIMKNELAAGTLPTGKYGANAAWWRLNTLVHNIFAILKQQALPPSMQSMRPKAIRYRLFNLAARITRHARRMLVHISSHHPAAAILKDVRESLRQFAQLGEASPG